MISEIKKILYATDLSKNSAYAFQYATDLAEKHDALIHIVHVIEEIPSSAKVWIDSYLTEEQKETLSRQKPETIEDIRSRLNIFCENVQKDDPQCVFRVASIDVIDGYPAYDILRKADELDCDVIVMGTHGKGVLSHAFLGSVAEKVLRRARKPVFIIPLPGDETELAVQDI
ncbi:universal stress protein [Thermodesulfobacteriota bacterium]